MAFPVAHPHYTLVVIQASASTDDLHQLPVCSGLSSPPTGHFLPPTQYLPVEYPLRNCQGIPPPQGFFPPGENYSQPSFGSSDPKVQKFGAEKCLLPHTLSGDQHLERLEGGEANLHSPSPADMQVVPQVFPLGTDGGFIRLAPHRPPCAGSHSATVDFPLKSLLALSPPSCMTEVDQIRVHSVQEGGLVFAVDDPIDRPLYDGATSTPEAPSRDESPMEGQPRDLPQPVHDSPSVELDPGTDSEGTENPFLRIEGGFSICMWKDGFDGHCGFTSRDKSVKQHYERVHLRLR